MMEDRLPHLPRGWIGVKLEEIGEINPKFGMKGIDENAEVTFLPMRCVEQVTGHIDLSLTKKLSEVLKGYTSFSEGDLLLAKITPCMENGKIAIAKGLKNGIGFGSTEFHVIRPYRLLPIKFFFFFLVQEDVRKDAQRNMTGSAGQLRVPANYIKQLDIPFPPLPEQHRIIAKIEELFTKLDAGVEALKKVKALLKRYRQAVLKYAFEGKLTQEWRDGNKNKLEPASVLLERIKEERKKKAGGKFKELPPVDTADLPELPKGWVWTSLNFASKEIYRYPTFYGMEHLESGIPVIRGEHIGDDGRISHDWDNYWFVSDEISKRFPKTIVERGDLIMSVRGSVGKIGLADDKLENAQVSPNCLRISLHKDFCLPQFVFFYLKSTYGQALVQRMTNATTIQTIKAGIFIKMAIPLPPFPEQKKIVEGIESRLSSADEVEKVAEQNLKKSKRLRHSILKTAFEGSLVPQDPTDEPAEKLLERIKAEKAKRESEPKGRRKKSNQMELI